MSELRKCGCCSEEDTVNIQCVDCGRDLCRWCVSCAGQCAYCVAKFGQPTVACSICQSRESGLCFCALCQCMVCKKCVSRSCHNRPTTVFCSKCLPSLSSLPLFPQAVCGRCNEVIQNKDMLFYCEVCADTLCGNCLSASFECGLLKCRMCCPSPVRLLSGDRLSRILLNDELKTLISSIAPKALPGSSTASSSNRVQMSKYRQLRKLEKLGQGGQGAVFKCITSDNEVVVSKEMIFSDDDRPVYQARLIQAERMRKLSHTHLIQYLDVFDSANPLKIYVIMPYYSEGDLSRFIKRQSRPINEHKLCSIILQIATALNYLHSQTPPLIHCDIKPENILLLNREEQVLLMDLDLCHSCDAQASATTRVLQQRPGNSPTFEYRAPEMACLSVSTKSDIFSLGVVAFVLATLPEFAMLQNGKGTTAVLSDSDWTPQSLARAVRTAIQKHTRAYSEELIDLIIRMLQHQPASRPQASEVITNLIDVMQKRLLENGN